MKRIAIVFFFYLQLYATALLAQANNIPGSGFEAGSWLGAAYADDNSGSFSHCVVFAGFGSERKRMVSFSLTEQGNLILGLGSIPAEGTTRPVGAKIYIDDLPPVEMLAEVDVDRNTVLTFPATDLVFEVFQAGWLMTIDVDGWRQTYKLRGTRKSLEALSECALRYGLYEGRPASSADSGASNPKTAQPEREPSGKSGSGFVVSSGGHVLTNAHVVDGCSIFSIDSNPATLVSISQDFDLAILQANFDPDKPVAAFSPRSAKLNSDVTVLGYPYAGILGGLNITRGAVSALRGLEGNETHLQITAPVQSGNSGGPVVGSDGEVVGVVVSKLDAIKVSDVLGDLPQNVNFAVRGEIAKMFLSQNGVEPVLGNSDEAMSPISLGEQTAKFTVFVECR